jgi:hypothetical protein
MSDLGPLDIEHEQAAIDAALMAYERGDQIGRATAIYLRRYLRRCMAGERSSASGLILRIERLNTLEDFGRWEAEALLRGFDPFNLGPAIAAFFDDFECSAAGEWPGDPEG